MTDRNRTLGGLALALVAAAGLVFSPSVSNACGNKNATKTASVVPASNAGTQKASASGCPAAAMAGCTAHGASAAGCAATCGAATKTAQVSLPEGTKVEKKEVEGGLDFVFTSSQPAVVQEFLAAHIAGCKDGDQAKCGETCTVTTTEDNHIILSVRGKNATSCAMSTMLVSYMDEQAGEEAPSAKKS